MSRSTFPALLAGGLLLLSLTSGCLSTSVIHKDESAGINGSFELTRSGMPVNWNIYQKGLGRQKAKLSFDTGEVRDGVQSLKFEVITCSDQAAWQSPGLFQSFTVLPGSAYRVSFWLKNHLSKFHINIDAETGPSKPPANCVLTEEGLGEEWDQYDTTISTRGGQTEIRFELNITGPGTLWLDGVKVEEVEGN